MNSLPNLRALVLLLAVSALGAGTAGGAEDFRSIDGTGNSAWKPDMGAAETPLLRKTGVAYEDFMSSPAGAHRPGAREISNGVAVEREVVLNEAFASDFIWLWGQFLDHDMGLTEAAHPEEPMDIEVPRGDPWFDPHGTGQVRIHMTRSIYDPNSGHRRTDPRRQLNLITAWIDASNVYGSDEVRADALRRGRRGLLATSAGRLLPFNRDGLPNAGGPSPALYLAGDVRANEHVALTAMHTLWVREHNRYARKLRRSNPRLDDEEIYQRSRRWVGALMQGITYNEFLPIILGRDAIPEYEGWDPTVDAGIANEFSTAAYRFGHSMVSDRLMRLNKNLRPIRAGHLPLQEAFFNAGELRRTGIEAFFRGLAYQRARRVDNMVVDDLRNFLFGPPGAGGFDLASLNIQRGRDHGLEDLNGTRRSYGLKPYRYFHEITSDREVADTLEELYGDINDVDLWVGGLAEDHVRGAMLGETFRTVLRDQFLRLRNGDRYFYLDHFTGNELRELERTTLGDVIRRNTRVGREVPRDVFRVR